MSAAPEHDDESVLLVAHKHWAGFVPDIAFAVTPVGLFLVLWLITGTVGGPLHAMFTLLLPLVSMVVWILLTMLATNYFLDLLIVSDRRIFYAAQLNLASRTVSEWDIHDVRRIDVVMGNALESFFKYGSLVMELRDQTEPVVFERVPDPEYVSAVILKQDDRYGELKTTAEKQRELLHFISHEVKGHLAKSKAAFASIVEGDYGSVSTPLSTMAEQALADTQKGVDTVMSVLENPDFREGKAPALVKKPFDLSETVRRSVANFRTSAAKKGIEILATIDGFCAMNGDEHKIEEHVIRNLLDNAIRYTPAGHIEVILKKSGKMARLTVLDTGVGMSPEDMKKLFTEGGHGEHSKETNPDSTGYGLFVAKQIVEANGGRMSARSDGPGTGSTFSVEFQLG